MITEINKTSYLPFYANSGKTDGTGETSETLGVSAKYDLYDDGSSNSETSPETLWRELERIREQAESTGKSIDSFGKALKIAARIMCGDIVPDKDDKFLLENYPDMHLRAWMLRRAKEDPKRHKSEFQDDNDIQSQVAEMFNAAYEAAYSCDVSDIPVVAAEAAGIELDINV